MWFFISSTFNKITSFPWKLNRYSFGVQFGINSATLDQSKLSNFVECTINYVIIVDWFGLARQVVNESNKQTSKQTTKRHRLHEPSLTQSRNHSASGLVEDFCGVKTANEAFSFYNIYQNVSWLLKTRGDETIRKRDGMGPDKTCSLWYFTPVLPVSKCVVIQRLNWRVVREQKTSLKYKEKLCCRLRSVNISH